MSRTRVKLNYQGFNELRKSPEMRAALTAEAQSIAQRAGEGYETDEKLFLSRAVASVATVTPQAMRDNLENNTLLKAVSS